MKRLLFFLIASCFFPQVILAQAQASMSAPLVTLFDSEEIIDITLASEMKVLFSDIGDERVYHPASLSYVSEAGLPVTVAAELRTRGNFRRQRNVCNLPPIRVKVDPNEAAGTLFSNQKKLKLVTVCQYKKDQYEQNLVMEYLAYRAYNLLTDSSFQVRLARITLIDVHGSMDTIRRCGFFIEDEDQMAARLGGKIFEIGNVHPLQTDRHTTARMSMFQYMIGNTDWSIPALHNIRLVGTLGGIPPVVVPYDFDWSGLVSAPYAKPDPKLGISTVEARLYRDYCRTKEELTRVFDEFRAAKPSIYALYEQCEMLDEKYRAKALAYFDEFYKIIDNEKRVEREIMAKCRTPQK